MLSKLGIFLGIQGKGDLPMFKKIGSALLLAVVLVVSGINLQTGQMTQVQACRTIPECRKQAQERRDNIAELTEEAGGVSDDVAALQAEIDKFQAEIDDLELQSTMIESQLAIIQIEVRQLSDYIDSTIATIDETNEQINELSELIARRMRATQRFNNTNTMLSQLSGASDLTEFINVIRQAQRAVMTDSELMEELTTLMNENRERYNLLQDNVALLEERSGDFRALQTEFEEQQKILEESRTEIMESQQQLQDQLDALYNDLAGEESMLAAIEMAEWILTNTPPPAVVTPPESPDASGLAHPMPGARVISEFGQRWGAHHAGLDLVMWGGSDRAPILAAASGVVIIAGWHNSMGNWVVISHNINGARVDTVYAHLRYTPPVAVGEIVTQGQEIGIKGSTGHSYGPHLHFEVHPGGFGWSARRGVCPRGWINF